MSEDDLDARVGRHDTDYWLPNLSVDEEAAEQLTHSRLRAGVVVHLGTVALPSAIASIERSLDGRVPRVFVEGLELRTHFLVSDESDRSWMKVVEMGLWLAGAFGGVDADLIDFHIREMRRVTSLR